MKTLLYWLRASGKTTIWESVAQSTDSSFVDMDVGILEDITAEFSEIKSIASYVNDGCKWNWDPFRNREHEKLDYLMNSDTQIISAGWGLVAFKRNRELIRQHPVLKIFLDIDVETQIQRLEEDDEWNKNRPDLGQSLQETYNQRIDHYWVFADVTIDVREKNRQSIVDEILWLSQFQEAIKKSA